MAGRPHTLDLEPQLGAFAAGDVLSDVLRTVRLPGALFLVVGASSPWAIGVPEAARLAPPVLPRAQHCGYESEAAFSRTFKRVTGVPPATWRDQPAARASAPVQTGWRPPSRGAARQGV